MFKCIFSSAYIQCVAVGQEWLSAQAFDCICYCFCPVRTQKSQVARFAEVNFYSCEFTAKVNVAYAGSSYQLFQLFIIGTSIPYFELKFHFFKIYVFIHADTFRIVVNLLMHCTFYFTKKLNPLFSHLINMG